MESLTQGRAVAGVALLAALWAVETWLPFFHEGRSAGNRLRHARSNLLLTCLNLVVIGVAFSSLVALAAEKAASRGFGLLRWAPISEAWRAPLAVLLLDGWMYAWHRLNHVAPFLWRFHRVHHSDAQMDVTTATRFHPGELAMSALARVAIAPLLGIGVWHVALYELVMLPIIQFHHSNVRLPDALDRSFRVLFVSPNMHRVHHSRRREETDSNYASVFSFWDRIAGTFRHRNRPDEIVLGLDEFADESSWRPLSAILKTPLLPTARETES